MKTKFVDSTVEEYKPFRKTVFNRFVGSRLEFLVDDAEPKDYDNVSLIIRNHLSNYDVFIAWNNSNNVDIFFGIAGDEFNK